MPTKKIRFQSFEDMMKLCDAGGFVVNDEIPVSEEEYHLYKELLPDPTGIMPEEELRAMQQKPLMFRGYKLVIVNEEKPTE